MCCEMAKEKAKAMALGLRTGKACCIAGTNFTASLGCLGLCPRWPETNVHHWSKESGRGQWPWIGLKDANIGAKWLVILLEHVVGEGQRLRGYSRHNTTSSRCLQTAVCLYTHSWHVFLLCARAHACMHRHHRFDHKPALLNSNVIRHGITEQHVW